MFSRLFDFSFRRTPLQAVGWYLFFLLLALLIGAIVGGMAAVLASAHSFAEGASAGMAVGRYIGPIFPIVICGMVITPRPLNAANVIVALFALVASLILGWLVAGVFIAWLTTQPPRNAPDTIPRVFD